MYALNQIVNLKLHPINNSSEYLIYCKNKLKKDSILKLDNFLLLNSLKKLQKEAENLKTKAYYCHQKHTILLNKKNKKIKKNDPLNIEVESNKGCVPHDLIPINSDLLKIYKSKDFRNFLTKVLDLKKIYPYKDKLSSINYNYYNKNQQLGWHFDNASFAITLMIESSKLGGNFQYINNVRDVNNNYINKDLINAILKDKLKPKQIKVNPGTLILFYGRNYLHRVTPVLSKKNRILVTLNYNLEKNIELSENARLTFFGRIN